ncbi:acetolactate synthase small subunit [Marinicella sediminis]|uniref:Acetolactate synthase small subunit n=1 Tax=Marinicella sediminis TaxID=1792834 RepID=A0ABV7J418_9GAMM|nr:acetolactate synthase small subunit [Marinicella sediminis]
MKRTHHFAIDSNDQAGILNRITAVFSRVNLNIESLSVCETAERGVFRHSVQVFCDQAMAKRLSKQLERQIEVIRAGFLPADELIQQEVALYKIASSSMLEQTLAEQIIHRHHARVLSMNSEYTVIEKTGSRVESQALLDDLAPIGVLEFVRSGPVSISKPMTAGTSAADMSFFKQSATCDTHQGDGVEPNNH